ncbi:MAG: hypothetical protein ABL907_03485 [Hyphomicrobium sp.]
MNRREVLVFAGAGFVGVALPDSLSAAMSDELRTPLQLLNGLGAMLSHTDEQFERTLRAAVYALTEHSEAPAQIAREIKRLVAGGALSPKTRTSMLAPIFEAAQKNLAGAANRAALTRSLEGVVSRSANQSLWLTAMATRGTPSLPLFLKGVQLDPRINLEISQDTLSAISDAVRRKLPIARAAALDDFRRSFPLDVTANVNDSISGLPAASQQLIHKIQTIGLEALSKDAGQAQAIFKSGVDQAFATGRRQYEIAVSAIGSGQSLLNAMRASNYQTAAKDMHAVGMLAAFVFSGVLKDPRTAQKISAGMQLGMTAFKIGAAFATGGIGTLAMAGTLMSGLGPMQDLLGGGGSEGAATGAMLEQISNQIDTLRSEMHSRFDRLETLQQKALEILWQLSKELRDTRVLLSDKIDKVELAVVQHHRYQKNVNRSNKLEGFDQYASDARSAISNRNAGRPIDYKAVETVKRQLLIYAISVSGNPDFTGGSLGGTLQTLVAQADRVDLLIAHLGRATKLLGIETAPNLTNSPIEWARGVGAFMELHACIPSVRNGEIDELIEKAWEVGKELRVGVQQVVNVKSFDKALESFKKQSAPLGKSIAAAIRSSIGKKLYVGLHAQPAPTMSDGIREHNRSETTACYINQRPTWDARGFTTVDNDPLLYAIRKGSIILVAERSEEIREVYEKNGLIAQMDVGTISHSRMFKTGTRQDLGPIGLFKYFTNDLGIWDTSMRSDPSREALWRAIGAYPDGLGLDHREEIVDFLQKPHSLKEFADGSADEITAAILLYSTMVGWTVTDEPDDPWHGYAASLLPRSFEELRVLLTRLAKGVSRREVSLLAGIPEETLMELRNVFASDDPRSMLQFNWRERHVHLDFERLAAGAIDKWYSDGFEAIQRMRQHIHAGNSIPLVDRAMLKLNTVRYMPT